MNNIIFLGYDVNLGLTFHFVDWVETMHELSNKLIKITVITLNREQYPGLLENLKKIPVTTIFINNNEDLENLNIFQEANIVHCHGIRHVSAVQKIRSKRNLNFKMLVTMHAYRHGYWYRPIYTNIVSFLVLNKVEMLHFVSQASRNEFLSSNLLYRRNNASVVFPLGCKGERFRTDVNIEHLEFFNELNSCDKNIVYLADLIPRKNHIWLINILKFLLLEENARLWLFGKGPEDKTIKRLIKDNNLDSHIFLPGRVDGKYIPSILKRMRLAVCASKSETMGHVIMEPMFAGIPVVTLDVGIASSIIRDFTTGFIIRDKSENRNFTSAIKFLLNNDKVSKEMGENAKLFAEKWLTWNITAQNCLNLYKSLT